MTDRVTIGHQMMLRDDTYRQLVVLHATLTMERDSVLKQVTGESSKSREARAQARQLGRNLEAIELVADLLGYPLDLVREQSQAWIEH